MLIVSISVTVSYLRLCYIYGGDHHCRCFIHVRLSYGSDQVVFRCNHICNLAVSDRTFVNLLMVLHGRGHLCCLFRQFISESAFLKPNTEPTNSVFCIACAKIGF